MQKKIFFIIFALTVQVQTLTFDDDLHCSCESLTVDECKSYYKEDCKVNGSECITKTFSCADLTETECASNKLRCKWDSSCVDFTYQCSDFNSDQAKCQEYFCLWKDSSCSTYQFSCSDMKTAESCLCYWNKSDVCEEFSKCENYSLDHCPSSGKNGCRKTETDCVTLACSDITEQYSCTGYLNDETACAWNSNGQCVEIASDSTCTDLDDFENLCTSSYECKYSNGSCTYKTCADFSLEYCETSNAYVSKTEYNLCTVSESKCVEMTDTIKLTKDNCGSQTSYNYHWTKDGKCEECADLISESSSNEIIIGIMMMIYLVA